MNFFKYDSSGNDFILLSDDYRDIITPEKVRKLCHRNHGIGADGVFIIEDKAKNKLKLEMFNSDGSIATMCANGTRAAIKYAYDFLGKNGEIFLETLSGDYLGWIEDSKVYLKFLKLPKKIQDLEVEGFQVSEINSGCEHAVIEATHLGDLDLESLGPKIRYNEAFSNGVNVNFIEVTKDDILIRTYEKGCERETLSCGTGIMASAYYLMLKTEKRDFEFKAKGGDLFVTFKEDFALYFGEVSFVYSGVIN